MKIIAFIIIITNSLSVFSQIYLSDSVKTVVLDRHNFFRQIVGSTEFYWSEDLVEIAEAEAINIAENPISADPNTAYGINIYKSSTYTNFTQAVNYWADEQKYYHGQDMNEDNVLRFGRYTQIIWNSTVAVGCALAQNRGGRYIFVCAYSPKGNIIGEKPY